MFSTFRFKHAIQGCFKCLGQAQQGLLWHALGLQPGEDIGWHQDHAILGLDCCAIQPKTGETLSVGIPSVAENQLGDSFQVAFEHIGITGVQGAAPTGRLLRYHFDLHGIRP